MSADIFEPNGWAVSTLAVPTTATYPLTAYCVAGGVRFRPDHLGKYLLDWLHEGKPILLGLHGKGLARIEGNHFLDEVLWLGSTLDEARARVHELKLGRYELSWQLSLSDRLLEVDMVAKPSPNAGP